MDVPWDIFWHAQAYRGKVGILDDRRDALSMPMQRDAMHAGVRPDLNTEDADADLEGREPSSPSSAASATRRSRSPTTRRCPRPRRCCTNPGRATCCRRRLLLPAEGRQGRRAVVLGPEQNGVVQNDFLCIGRTAKSPVLAHEFINFMLDEKNAYDNFVNFTGYTPPQNAIDAESLIKQGLIPKSLDAGRRAARPVRGQPGAAPAERRGPAALGRRLGEVQGRLMRSRWTWRLLALPGRRLAVGLLPRRVLRGARGRVRQPGHALAAGAVLEPARLERRLRRSTCSQPLARRAVLDRLAAHDRVRRDRGGPLAARSATRSPTSRRATRGRWKGASCSP